MIRKRYARILSWVLSQAPFSRQQWVAVSVSFLLAVTLWFLVTINTQSYTTEIEVPVRLANFPGEYQLVQEFPKSIKLKTTGVGIKLIYEAFDKPDTFLVDFQDFEDRPQFVAHQNLYLFDQILQEGLKTVQVFPDTISFKKLKKASKKVPVVFANQWNLPPTYRITGKILAEPDSVLVTGPLDSLTRIGSWPTMKQLTASLDGPMTLEIPMDTHATFMVVPSKINVKVNPEPYTELNFLLPIRTLNAPRFTDVHFEPDTVNLRVLAPFRLADSIKSNQFSVAVDYNSISTRSDFVVPFLVNSSDLVQVIGFSPDRVRYLIISKLK
jgi:YbbR domain-containing protein